MSEQTPDTEPQKRSVKVELGVETVEFPGRDITRLGIITADGTLTTHTVPTTP